MDIYDLLAKQILTLHRQGTTPAKFRQQCEERKRHEEISTTDSVDSAGRMSDSSRVVEAEYVDV